MATRSANLKHGGDVESTLTRGISMEQITLFERAVRFAEDDNVEELAVLFKGDPLLLLTHRHVDSRTLLQVAIAAGGLRAAGLLLDNGADPFAVDKWGKTALHFAVASGSPRAVAALCDIPGRRVFPLVGHLRRQADYDGATPLHLAAALVGDQDGSSAAMMAPLLCDIPGVDEQAEELLHIPDAIGSTPLHIAAEHGSPEAVAAMLGACDRSPLIPTDVTVNRANEVGNTALHRAARRGHTDVVALLLQAGADPRLDNSAAETAADLASKAGHHEVAGLLHTAAHTIRHNPVARCVAAAADPDDPEVRDRLKTALAECYGTVKTDVVRYYTEYNKHLVADGGEAQAHRDALEALSTDLQAAAESTGGAVRQPDLPKAPLDPDPAKQSPASRSKYIKELGKALKPVGKEVERVVRAICAKLDTKYYRGPSKRSKHVLDKAALRYDGEIRRVTDVERFAVVCIDLEQMSHALREANSALTIVRIKNRFRKRLNTAALSAGYRDCQVLVSPPGSQALVEIQFQLGVVNAVRESAGEPGRKRYEAFRTDKARLRDEFPNAALWSGNEMRVLYA